MKEKLTLSAITGSFGSLLLCCLVCVLCLFSFTTPTKKATEKGQYHALFIAIDDYSGKVWSPLKNPVKDAKAIRNILKSKYNFESITTLFNQQATRKSIIETLDKVTSNLKENDNLIIFYTGHGVVVGSEGYWVPVEAQTQERYELVATSEIKTALSKTNSKHVLVLVDACFSSSIFKSSPLSHANDGTENYYARVDNLLSRQAITAGGLEPVPDGTGNHSIFTKYIIKFLQKNEKELLDASELFEMIKYPVAANTPNMPQFGHIQNTGHEGGQFIFRLEKAKICDSHVEIKEGEQVQFDQKGGILHAVTSQKNIRYEWTYNTELLDNDQPTLKVTKSGTYGVTVITPEGECSDAALAEVKIVMPEIALDILEGSRVEFTYKGTLNAQLTGYSGKVLYEWKKNSFLVGNQPKLEVKESDVYTVTVKLPDGRILGTAKTDVLIQQRIYSTQLGDNVRRISKKFYGNANNTALIYNANPSIKRNEVLRVGTRLIIPGNDKANGEPQQIIAGGIKAFPPFSDEDHYKGGMVTDIVKAVFKEMEQPVKVDYMPSNQLKGMAYNGRIGVAFPYPETEQDRLLFRYSDPLYNTLHVLFARKGTTITDVEKYMKKASKQREYKKLVVGIPIGFHSNKLVEWMQKEYLVLKPFQSLEGCFNALKNGDIDLVAGPQTAGLVTLQDSYNHNMGDYIILDKELETNTLHLIVSNAHPDGSDIIADFNKALKKLKNMGKITAITDAHIDLIQKGN